MECWPDPSISQVEVHKGEKPHKVASKGQFHLNLNQEALQNAQNNLQVNIGVTDNEVKHDDPVNDSQVLPTDIGELQAT